MQDSSRSAPNRLCHATSPYLLQHAHNPVDWYEWGPDALERARSEDRPIFLSIGYSACHWCHVMAHESFESEPIAAIMNRLFINIKVDREERPDLDDIFMQATLAMNQGQGGWPMSVWLTPEGLPFFAGTYYPPESRWGRVGFGDLCERIGQLWAERRDDIRADAQRLGEYVQAALSSKSTPGTAITLEHVDRTADLLAGAFDAERGGLVSGGTNKFPPSMALELMMRSAARRSDDPARRERIMARVRTTLEHMAAGGIFDHLAGGIARYSTDVDWLVPHFEKMLYDQALVSRAYLHAWQLTAAPDCAAAVRSICEYVIADLQSPEGGYYSARDADSEGEEGRYYVWTRAEIDAALGAEAALFCSAYGVSAAGNWSDPHAPGVAKNILHLPRPLEEIARESGLGIEALEHRLAKGRARLLEIRGRRVAPHRDEKILCEWNGLMIGSMARAGAALDEPRFVESARRAVEFVLAHQRIDGRLRRSWRDGRVTDSAFLSDYAALIEGLLDLYEATFDRRWLREAETLNRDVLRRFASPEGGFYFTADDHESLLTRPRDVRDGAAPAGNSVQLMNLLRLSIMLGDDELRAAADRSLAAFAADVLTQPGSAERFLQAAEFALAGPVEIAIAGDPQHAATRALVRAAHEVFAPNRVLMLANPAAAETDRAFPLLADRRPVDGTPAAYVCRRYACERPITSPDELRARLQPGG